MPDPTRRERRRIANLEQRSKREARAAAADGFRKLKPYSITPAVTQRQERDAVYREALAVDGSLPDDMGMTEGAGAGRSRGRVSTTADETRSRRERERDAFSQAADPSVSRSVHASSAGLPTLGK